jgi:hypothetical protein
MRADPLSLTIAIEAELHSLTPIPVDTITMQAANGQRIVIHLATGEVDLCGLTPSEGARLFWDAVQRHLGRFTDAHRQAADADAPEIAAGQSGPAGAQ